MDPSSVLSAIHEEEEVVEEEEERGRKEERQEQLKAKVQGSRFLTTTNGINVTIRDLFAWFLTIRNVVPTSP
jgi:hypothetical protein